IFKNHYEELWDVCNFCNSGIVSSSMRGEKTISAAVEGANRMRTLIQDLLAYSRVTSRGAAFTPTDCSDVLERALANLKVAIDEGGAVVTYTSLPTVPGDATQLQQVFQNLVGNAINFVRQRHPPSTSAPSAMRTRGGLRCATMVLVSSRSMPSVSSSSFNA